MTTKGLRFIDAEDATDVIADVEIPMAWWELFKRHARKRHMKVGDFISEMVGDYTRRVIAEHKGGSGRRVRTPSA